MTTTGIPVTLNLFNWLASYAVNVKDLFDKTNHHNQLVNQYMNQSLDLDSLTIDDQLIIQNFIRLLVVTVLQFDGGIMSTNIQSISHTNDTLTIVWANSVSYSIDVAGWTRQNRKAIDYVVNRCCGVDNFLSNIHSNIVYIKNFIFSNRDQMQSLYLFAKNDVSLPNLSMALSNNSVVFTILSCIPLNDLQLFYVDLSHLFSDGHEFSFLGVKVFVKPYFLRPVTDERSILDKVKMHYALQEYTDLDPDVRQLIVNKTHDFLKVVCTDQAVFSSVKNQLNQLVDSQIKPQLDFLNVIEQAFFSKV